MKPIMIIAGTRPEIIKMAPTITALNHAKMPSVLVLCGQHYDYNMAQQFIENLQLPNPDYTFKVKALSPGVQAARIMMKIDQLLEKAEPSIVLVEGDTNSVMAAAFAANKRAIPIGHVEAGLRSFDLRMPEEHNRRLTDHLSQYLFAPTERASANLQKESVWGKIHITGNTSIDAVTQYLPVAEKKSVLMEKVPFNQFILATIHRQETTSQCSSLSLRFFHNRPFR